jgi:hypothetical protein
MTNQTRNVPRTFVGPGGEVLDLPVDANTQIFAGMALLESTSNGTAILATATASGEFLGIAEGECNNLTGSDLGGAAAAGFVKTRMRGPVILTVARASSTFVRTDRGATVYASDASTFTTDAGTNNIVIGKIMDVPPAAVGAASAELVVYVEASCLRSI